MVEQKFEAIVEKFEVFQEAYVQEFEDFIPAARDHSSSWKKHHRN